MSKLILQLVTPERTLLNESYDKLVCPTQMGEITILPKHADLVTELASGEMIATVNNQDRFLHIAGGFLHITNGDKVTVLADAAEHSEEIDLARAEEALERAESTLKSEKISDEQYMLARASLERSLSRIKIARRRSSRTPRPNIQDTTHLE